MRRFVDSVPRKAVWAILLAVPFGCEAPTNDAADDRDQTFVGGKADGACVDAGTPTAAGILALVNDPSTSFAELDDPVSTGGVGLDRRAAEGIVDARPFADLFELDEVPYVGVSACGSLARFACNERGLCRESLRTAAWNLEHFPLTDETEAAVPPIVDELELDLIGTQEMEDPDAFFRTVDALGGYEGLLGLTDGFNGVGVIYRASRLEAIAAENVFVGERFAFPRPMLAVTFAVRGTVPPVRFVFGVVHLKASGDSESQSRRRAAIERLRDFVDDQRANGIEEIILAGDWNDELDDSESRNVFGPLLDPDAGVEFLTEPLVAAGDATFIPSPAFFDHIAVTDSLAEVLRAESTEVMRLDETFREDYVDNVSDHRPVRTTFSVAMPYLE